MIFLHHTLSNPLAQQCLRLLELQEGTEFIRRPAIALKKASMPRHA
jgi:hypothetical protein